MTLCLFCNKIIAKKKGENQNFDISFISEFLQLSADCQSEINNLKEHTGAGDTEDEINDDNIDNCEECFILLEKGHSILDQIKNLQSELGITRDRLWGQIEISASENDNNNNLKKLFIRELEQRKSERIIIGSSSSLDGDAENDNLIIVENVMVKNEIETEEEEFNINSTYLQFLDHENDNIDRQMEIVKEEEAEEEEYDLNEGSIIIKSEDSNFQFNEELNELLPNEEAFKYENEEISQKKPQNRNKKFILIPNLKTKFYCADCRKSFKNGIRLRRHYTTELHKQNKSSTSVDIIEETGRFGCEICNIKYFDQYTLNQHLKSRKHKKALENKSLFSGDNSKEADEGNLNIQKEIKILSDPLIEKEKLETNTNINWNFCRICKINYASVAELKRHYITNFHRKNIRAFGFKCELCNKKYATHYHLQRHFHSKGHLKANEAAGNNIQTDSPSPSTSANGGINLEPNSRYNCEPCKKYFFERYRLDEHFKTKRHLMKISIISHDYISDQDDKNEEENEDFEDNSPISSKEEKITLDIDFEGDGEEDSSSKTKLHPPMTKREKLKCKKCKKSFKNRHTLNSHAVIHSGKKPYKCQICGWRFNFKSYLEAHKKSHLPDEEKEFKCDQCPKAFGVKGHYKIHLLTHKSLTERPWKCNYCEKTFITNTKRKNHENIHNLFIM